MGRSKQLFEKNDTYKEVEGFKEKVRSHVVELVSNKFPQKVLELDKLLASEKFSLKNTQLAHVEINIPVPDFSANEQPSSPTNDNHSPSVKRRKLWDEEDEDPRSKPILFPKGVVESNAHVIELQSNLKPILLELVGDICELRLGIQLMIPQMEDGNNFGVDVQNETLGELQSAEEDVQSNFNLFSTYFAMRGEFLTKIVKYPHAADYRRALQEHDEKCHFNLCITLHETRNYYITLQDLVMKNLNKIKNPKPSACEREALY